MSKQIDALKLALEALEHEAETGNDDAYRRERDVIREALADSALERMAENERELGLDYMETEQPAQQPCEAPCGDIKCAVMCKRHEQPVQQESEAVRAAWMAGYTEGEREAIEKEQPANVAAVNTSSERVDKTEENVHEKNI